MVGSSPVSQSAEIERRYLDVVADIPVRNGGLGWLADEPTRSIDTAQELFNDPTRSITDIGYLTGFADTAHFSRTFKHASGLTPSDGRAMTSNRSG